MTNQSLRSRGLLCISLLGLLIGVLALTPGVANAQITVTSAAPNNAPQGTLNLNVTVGGSGFKKDAQATWYVSGSGTDTGGVVVNSTTFNSSSQLTANITVPETATASHYDIHVSSAGRTGVGSDLFTVNPEEVTSYLYDTDATGTNTTFQSDGISLVSGATTYNNTPISCTTSGHPPCTIESLLPNDWYLGLNGQTSRMVRLTFHALNGSPDESALDGYYPAHMATRCYDAANNWMSIPTTIPPGTSNNRCSLRIDHWSASSTQYLWIMTPDPSMAPGPATGWSTVSCTSGTGTQTCDAWTITPTPANLLPNPSLANVGNLYIVAKSGKLTLVGQYLLTFNIALTHP